MSEESKQAGNTTEQHLKRAEEHLGEAARTSKETGDKTLIKKVAEIKEATAETRKELKKNLEQ
jgi:hypothetical protein